MLLVRKSTPEVLHYHLIKMVTHTHLYNYIILLLFSCFLWLLSLSTFIGYLMPKSSGRKIIVLLFNPWLEEYGGSRLSQGY